MRCLLATVLLASSLMTIAAATEDLPVQWSVIRLHGVDYHGQEIVLELDVENWQESRWRILRATIQGKGQPIVVPQALLESLAPVDLNSLDLVEGAFTFRFDQGHEAIFGLVASGVVYRQIWEPAGSAGQYRVYCDTFGDGDNLVECDCGSLRQNGYPDPDTCAIPDPLPQWTGRQQGDSAAPIGPR